MSNPREHDIALAEKWHELAKAEQQVAYNESHLLNLAKAKYYYRGRRRVTDMKVEEAIEKVAAALAQAHEWEATHEGEGTWIGFESTLPPYEIRTAREQITKRFNVLAEVERIKDEIRVLEEGYTGWSRFFVVTSSTGHIHSSMHCSTCRPTTTYGWLPELSGKSEAEAVEAHGPALCSICFPSAPVEHVGAKLSKTQAERAAH